MNREQKQAWLVVAMFGVSVIAFAALVPLVGWKVAPCGFALFGISGLSPLIFRKKTQAGQVEADERDKKIAREATLAGGMMSYLVFILACMVPWFIYHARGAETISIHRLPMIAIIGMIVLVTTRSVTLLVLYGREGRHREE